MNYVNTSIFYNNDILFVILHHYTIRNNLAGVYQLKVNNRNTRTRYEICSYFTPCSNVSVFNFEQVNAGWGNTTRHTISPFYVNDLFLYPLETSKNAHAKFLKFLLT